MQIHLWCQQARRARASVRISKAARAKHRPHMAVLVPLFRARTRLSAEVAISPPAPSGGSESLNKLLLAELCEAWHTVTDAAGLLVAEPSEYERVETGRQRFASEPPHCHMSDARTSALVRRPHEPFKLLSRGKRACMA